MPVSRAPGCSLRRVHPVLAQPDFYRILVGVKGTTFGISRYKSQNYMSRTRSGQKFWQKFYFLPEILWEQFRTGNDISTGKLEHPDPTSNCSAICRLGKSFQRFPPQKGEIIRKQQKNKQTNQREGNRRARGVVRAKLNAKVTGGCAVSYGLKPLTATRACLAVSHLEDPVSWVTESSSSILNTSLAVLIRGSGSIFLNATKKWAPEDWIKLPSHSGLIRLGANKWAKFVVMGDSLC